MTQHDETCVCKVNGHTEAQQVKTFLEANGIPAFIRGESTRLTHGFTLNGLGVVRVCVLGEHADRANELMQKAEAGELAVTDADLD